LQREVDEKGLPINSEQIWLAAEATPFDHGPLPNPDAEDPGETPDPNPTENPEPDDNEQPEDNTPLVTTQLLPLALTELLPNPAAPQTDTNDEFVELYNPNDEPVDLNGYQVQAGTTYAYKFTLTNQTIPAKGYLIFTSGDTNLALANTAGKARLVAPDGSTVSETTPYEDAEDGQAWVLINGTWQWTTTPTPGTDNVLSLPTPTVKAASTKKTTTTKKKTTAKVATTKTSAKKSTAKPAARTDYEDPTSIDVAPVHPTVIAGVGLLALLYAGYEYRYDTANRLYQFQRYRAARREARTATSGR
jgi:hypothetical protein